MFEHGHTVPHSTLHTCTHRPHSHTVPSPLTPHTAPGLHECMHAHMCPHLEVGVAGRGSGGRREEEGNCPHLDLHLDLQVGPVDGEQRAVGAGGAQLPGTVGHVPVAVSQEDQRGEGGDLAGEGALVCRGGHRGLHFICTPTHISLPHSTHITTPHIFIALYSTYKLRTISEQQSHTQPVQLCAVGRCSSASCGEDEEKQLLVVLNQQGQPLANLKPHATKPN